MKQSILSHVAVAVASLMGGAVAMTLVPQTQTARLVTVQPGEVIEVACAAAPECPALPTPGVTPTPNPLPSGDNLLENPGFEDGWYFTLGGNVATGWLPYFCNIPYTPDKCPAERRDTQSPARPGFNDPELVMAYPEYKRTNITGRVHSGDLAQQFFSFQRVHRGGLAQIVNTQPGQRCTVSAWVQTWSSNFTNGRKTWDPERNLFQYDEVKFTSDRATPDDRANSTWRLGADPTGGVYAFANTVQWSRPFTFEDGHYDKYVLISWTFEAQGNGMTVFIENLRLYPLVHNDSYVDDASVVCASG